jgi:hypothetical protein
MSMDEEDRGPFGLHLPSGTRVAWSTGREPFAYVRGRILVRGEEAARHLDVVTRREHPRTPLGGRDEAPGLAYIRIDEVARPLAAVALLRADGFVAQPDHVLFAHCGDCCCGPHPALTFDALAGDPLHGNPLHGNPLHGNPLHGNPLHGNPFIVDPLHGNGSQLSTARPADGPRFAPRTLDGKGGAPSIVVLDTGLADGPQRPALLADPQTAKRITGSAEQPDTALVATGTKTTYKPDGWLDPVAGHGTFIAGLLEQLAPGCTVRVEHVLSGMGDAVESEVHQAILAEAARPDAERADILSLSFGGTVLDQAPALRTAITAAQLAGIVVVASAGNQGSCTPQYPAAYDGVVAVGALGPDGPAPWTNYGDWVDACAPGVDLVSSFFAAFDGPDPRINTADPDRFAGWATWSGTSFSAPVVVAALAREMVLGSCGAAEAVRRVVQAPHVLQIRGLGGVVGV